jgi:hypothetical protein
LAGWISTLFASAAGYGTLTIGDIMYAAARQQE